VKRRASAASASAPIAKSAAKSDEVVDVAPSRHEHPSAAPSTTPPSPPPPGGATTSNWRIIMLSSCSSTIIHPKFAAGTSSQRCTSDVIAFDTHVYEAFSAPTGVVALAVAAKLPPAIHDVAG
jgi:hypothetical protein